MKTVPQLHSLIVVFHLIPTMLLGQVIEGNEKAIQFKLSYTGDLVRNVSGGISTGTTYLGLVSAEASLLTGAAGLWKGGELFIHAANTHGGMPSATLVGDYQGVSNIEAGNHTFLQECWYKQQIGAFTIACGLQDMNSEFAVSEQAKMFLNGSFGIHSNIASNVPAPIFPLTSVGIRLSYVFSEWFSAQIACFDGLPDDFSVNPYNVEWKVNGEDGFLNVAEVCHFSKKLRGVYKLGGYYHNHVVHETIPGSTFHSPDYGFYLVVDQPILSSDNGCNVSMFAQAGLSPKKTDINHCYFGMGLHLTNFFSKRQEDEIGIACAHARVNQAAFSSETTLECSYLLKINTVISIQPDLQYVIHPSGSSEGLENALVTMLRVRLEL